eukprot:TRINITY_DN2373_c0_g1_i1.p2 TRINITY_DN2373_c0_g1~~TRINITY_DN2373_c0_g1_i1.p2  ORF type:complete len:211 (+),score=62.24 TRINITY_DN2373_c0_g1_i1:494-1126(+)
MSGFWHNSIIENTFMDKTKDRPVAVHQPSALELLNSKPEEIATAIFKVLMYATGVTIALLFEVIPYGIGTFMDFVLICVIYTFYCFDTRWVLEDKLYPPKHHRPADFTARIRRFEHRWIFFIGFGTPFTLLTFFFPTLVSCGVYALCFPIFAILAIHTEDIYMRTPEGLCLPSYLHVITFLKRATDQVFLLLCAFFGVCTGKPPPQLQFS